MTRGICCILIAAAVFAPIARKIYKRNHAPDQAYAEASLVLVDPGSSRPEPGERSAYLAGCLLAPLLLFGLTIAARRIEPRLAGLPPWTRPAAQIGLLLAACGYAWWLLAGDGFFHLSLNAAYLHPAWMLLVVFMTIAAAAWLGWPGGASRWAISLLVGIPLVVVLLESWMGENDEYVTSSIHFTAVYDPVAQVSLGKDLLNEYGSQYGLYPDFLAPLFAVTGLSVAGFTFVMAALSVGSFGLLWLVYRRAIRRPGVAVVGFVALVFNGWMMFQMRLLADHPAFFDPYYQYFPLRVIFPAAAVALVWSYHSGPSRRVYWVAPLALGFGVLWNLDSGLIALAAWWGALVFDALYESTWLERVRAAARHTAVTVLGAVAAVGCYSVAKFACYGAWPDFGRMIDYQRLFYLSGFYMLPMHFRGGWQLVILTYLAGLAYAAAALAAGRRGPRETLVFMVSVLGLGLFSYYQGRSHEYCLILCWWPALFLLPVFVDELMEARPERNLLAYGMTAVLGLFLIGSAASFPAQMPTLARATGRQLAKLFDSRSPFAEDARMVRAWVAPREQLLVLSANASLLEAEVKMPSFTPASLVQMLWLSQYESVLDSLEQRPHSWVFIDNRFAEQFFVNPANNSGSQMLLAAITPRLREVGRTEGGRLYEFYGTQSTAAVEFQTATDETADWEESADYRRTLGAAFQFVRDMPRYARQ